MVRLLYVDINGIKNPNIMGRDLFVFVLGNDGVLQPAGGMDVASMWGCKQDQMESCGAHWTSTNSEGEYSASGDGAVSCIPESLGLGCAGRIIEENWKMNY